MTFTCERTILNCSLAELVARRKLNESPDYENLDESVEIMRRPYLDKAERDLAAKLPESALKEYFRAGEFVHIPMTSAEKSLIEQFKRFNRKKGFEEFTEEDLSLLTEMLPGRKCDDVQNYLDDFTSGTENDAILVFTGGERCMSPSMPPSGYRKCPATDWMKYVRKQFSIFESSGSITQIACRSGPGHQNARIMIGACATQEERYNRVGEVIMAYKEKPVGGEPASNYEVLIIDGHKKAKSTPNGQVVMRQTVTCVVYDPLSDMFFSGGYDGDVVAWNAASAVSVDTVGSHPKPINSIACHSSRNLVAYGCQSGGLYYFDSFAELGSRKARPSALFTKPKAKDSFSNTIDHVAIPATGAFTNTCFAGIGYLQSFGAGIVEAWDLGTGSFSCASEKLSNGITCMNLSSCGQMLVAGTGGIASDDVKGDGIVRVLDLGQSLKTSIAIKTEKFDLDCVSFCPRSTLLFMGETSDSSIAVYDLRFPAEPLFTTTHGTPTVDSVVAHAWLSNGNVLATGGHDGMVNLWDCQRGFSLINKFEFNSSISCITYSEVDNSIWVGTDNGGVYMLASPGSLGENHPTVLSGKCVY